ncbi:hypothetical protein [Rhizobium sp. RM]|uniref:hypothetical protein n=1 Tax=Rhizobium sp. RM TaxID=2748079 RepID=UPI00110F5E8C|nr:hypothetical protein [Rhizobium sp. RM]NWJ25372.1 hypothetical protein [Rhizobium sp. RM]TMV17544.1 hypothetical protein BJG94_16365 [Rhizobium sp. Td3]
MGNSPFNHESLLRSLLEDWARRFTPDPTLQHELVETTIARTIDLLPQVAEEVDIDKHLFKTMHSIALESFERAAAEETQPQYRQMS